MKIYTVGECSELMASVFRKTYLTKQTAIRGTIVNLKIHTSGAVYFTLVDPDGRIFCHIAARHRTYLTRHIYNGCLATVVGDFLYHTFSGWPVLHVSRIMGVEESPLTQKKNRLQKELEKKGFLDPLKKKPLPAFPFGIGVITSLSGAVLHDIVKTGRLRNPSIHYKVWGASVQGKEAAELMAAQVREASESPEPPDILIIARGGGAEDDLSAFNEKVLLEAVHDCPIPVISAVGHETDVTLLDLVADVRASTPTQAAELAIPRRDLLIQGLVMRGRQMNYDVQRELSRKSFAVRSSLRFLSAMAGDACRLPAGNRIKKSLGHMTSLVREQLMEQSELVSKEMLALSGRLLQGENRHDQ